MGVRPEAKASGYLIVLGQKQISRSTSLRGDDNKKSKDNGYFDGRVVTVRVVRPWIQRAGRAPSVLMS